MKFYYVVGGYAVNVPILSINEQKKVYKRVLDFYLKFLR